MARGSWITTIGALACACTADGGADPSTTTSTDGGSSTGTTLATSTETGGGAVTTASEPDCGTLLPTTTEGGEASTTGEPMPTGEPLEVRFLGVGGFSFRHGEDLVLTAPMYTNPSLLEVQFGDIAADPARVDAFLATDFVADAAAILVGHAHYDHLLDVPLVWAKTTDALVLGNTSMRNLMLAAGLPDASLVPLDDPALAHVDMRMCPEANPCTGLPAGQEGSWVPIPGADVRTRALCSEHPAQIFGVVHFAEGCVAEVPAALPTRADEWKEGATLAYLVDFLDPDTRAIAFRVYVQDAPTDAPLGFPHPELLAERRIDLAVLNVGSWESVGDHPAAVIAAVEPRYVVAGHWEDFFRTQDQPAQPIPFQALPDEFDAAALAALGDDAEPAVLVDGVEQDGRYFRVDPGTDLRFAPAR